MSNMKPLSVYVLFATDADKKYIKINGDGCLAIFDDELSAETAKKKFPGTDFVQANYYTEKQVEHLKARVSELEASAVVPEGWKPMPANPTDEMIDAGADAINFYRVDVMRAYEAMVLAAPLPPEQAQES
jgi:hypothetical protein